MDSGCPSGLGRVGGMRIEFRVKVGDGTNLEIGETFNFQRPTLNVQRKGESPRPIGAGFRTRMAHSFCQMGEMAVLLMGMPEVGVKETDWKMHWRCLLVQTGWGVVVARSQILLTICSLATPSPNPFIRRSQHQAIFQTVSK